MNRATRSATVSRYHDESHAQVRKHLADFIVAYNCPRRLKGLTPFAFPCKTFLAEPDRFRLDPIRQMPGT